MLRRYRNATQNSVCLVALLGAVVCAYTSAQGPESSQHRISARPIAVCELLKHVGSYRGKRIVVRGIYWFGLRQSCAEAFVTRDHRWPSAINLVDSDSHTPNDGQIPFKTDRRSWDELDQLVLGEGRAGRREEIWVTIAGEVRAPQEYVRKDGSLAGGYGHLGVFPVELVVERVSDISVVPRPTFDYKELLRSHQ